MHSENPKISNFHWVTKLNFGGVPNFERFRKNAYVDQRFTAFSASPPLRWPQAPDAEPIANLAANVGGLDRQAAARDCRWTAVTAHWAPLLGLTFSPMKSGAPCVWASACPA
jgi:hypothetical protein